ncbi:MAG TPA: AbrB/MazE/SpoVT family DNA-binding domain-containing protein [Candidatus Nanoarchaeia archaeon]|nr:AbrB/MazE/SpoVT family DNA-binding domain-containing protein [Candidatus Nanoarchaeia archaeon]
MTSKLVRIGAKGQIVIRKNIRDELGLQEGTLLQEEVTDKGLLIKPIRGDDILRSMEATAKRISKLWPKKLSSVEAIRRERR